jgi:ADP-ribose diphosphatase
MIIVAYIAAAVIMAVGSIYFAWRNRDFRNFSPVRSSCPRAFCFISILPSHDGDLLMIEGMRDTTGPDSCFELPSGTIEAGERAEDAAIRELREETGFTAHTLLRIGEFVEAPGVSASRCIVFEV